MASNLRVDNILPSNGTNIGIGTAGGTITFLGNSNLTTSGDVTIGGNLGVGGTITYEDVARVDATGISTFREGFGVGPLTGIALTAYADGSIRTVGIITASTFGSDTNSIFTTGGSERLRITSGGLLGVNVTPAYSGLFGGSQKGMHIGGTTAPFLRITSSTGSQGDLILQAGNSGGDVQMGNLNAGGDIVFWNKPSGGSLTETLRIRDDGDVTITGASDLRLTIGNQGTAGTNDSNWIRGEGANFLSNAASGYHRWEIGGAEKMHLDSNGDMWLRSSSSGSRYIVLNNSGDSGHTISNNLNWVRGNGTNVQYNTCGGFHAWEISGSEKFRINSNGSASLTGSLSQNTSDDRLKKDKVEILNALDKVNSLSSFTHKWNDIAVRAGLEENKEEVGLSAQEVQSIHPSLVDINITIKDPEDPTTEYLTIHYHKVVPLLVASIKELTTKNETLEARIAALEGS